MVEAFCNWLVDTPLSHLFADRIWTIAVSQTIHILAVSVVMISVGLLNLRMLGVGGRDRSFSNVMMQSAPWIWTALTILLLTGIVQTLAEPGRELLNVAFRVKMLLLLCTAGITYFYQKTLRKDAHYWDAGSGHRGLGVTLAVISLVFWIGIVVAGRLIAYMDMRQMV